jgi:hypothetical protein
MKETELVAAAEAEAFKIVERFYGGGGVIEQYAPPITMEADAQELHRLIKAAIIRIAIESHSS